MNRAQNKRSWWMPGLAALVLSFAAAGCEVPAKQTGANVIVPSLWITVAGGGTHTLAIKGDGTLWAWGDNTHGQLGTGDTLGHSKPVQISAATSWISVSAGLYHSLALNSSGQLWVWGDNTYGQLGLGFTGAPVLVQTPIVGSTWAANSPSAGCYHSLAVQLTPTAGVYVWGANDFGQLANGGGPAPVPTPTLLAVVTTAVAGCTHNLGIDGGGTLYSWGNNDHAQLGFFPAPPYFMNSLINLGLTVSLVAAGESHSLAVGVPGNSLYGWGSNADGQAGSLPPGDVTVPTLVGAATDWSVIGAGQFHSVGARSAAGINTMWGWGRNNIYQLGDTNPDRSVPTPVAPNIGNLLGVRTGWNHSAAINSSAALFTWGANDKGQLGDGTTVSRPLPKAIP